MRQLDVVRPARGPDERPLGVGCIEPDELVDELAIAHGPREGAEHRGIAERVRILLRERRERDLLRELSG